MSGIHLQASIPPISPPPPLLSPGLTFPSVLPLFLPAVFALHALSSRAVLGLQLPLDAAPPMGPQWDGSAGSSRDPSCPHECHLSTELPFPVCPRLFLISAQASPRGLPN